MADPLSYPCLLQSLFFGSGRTSLDQRSGDQRQVGGRICHIYNRGWYASRLLSSYRLGEAVGLEIDIVSCSSM
jgi:hypothetical protein